MKEVLVNLRCFMVSKKNFSLLYFFFFLTLVNEVKKKKIHSNLHFLWMFTYIILSIKWKTCFDTDYLDFIILKNQRYYSA